MNMKKSIIKITSLILAAVLLCGLAGYRIYTLNKKYPDRTYIEIPLNEPMKTKSGVEYTVVSVETTENTAESGNKIFFVNIKYNIKNTSDKVNYIGFESMILEDENYYSNQLDINKLYELNSDIKDDNDLKLKPEEEKTLIIPFSLSETNYKSADEYNKAKDLKNRQLKIIYDGYPIVYYSILE